MQLTLRVFFRRIDVIGQENLPDNGPVIYVANHPSALMDPLVVGITVKQHIHFLAGSEWFGKGLKARIFRNHLNMIPVHRPWLSKDKKVSNTDMFTECYKSLSQGKSIILFPEASSVTVSKIRELKTGAIRIKSGYEEFIHHKEEVPIIPIGISYSDPHKFQSRVVVKIGKPVEFSDDYGDLDIKEIARAKTDQIQNALKESIINIENDENQNLVRRVNCLLIDTFWEDSDASFKDTVTNFEFIQNVAKGIEHYENNEPERFSAMSKRINNYFDAVNKLGLSDVLISNTQYKKPTVAKLSLLILGLPLALISLALFALPYQLTKRIFFKKLQPLIDPDYDNKEMLNTSFTGTLIFGAGSLIFIAWTILLAIVAGIFSGFWLIALGALILTYPIFRFSLYYAKHAVRLRNYLRGAVRVKKRTETVKKLRTERVKLVERLTQFQEEFDKLDVVA